MGLKPITKSRLSDVAIAQIKELIVTQKMEPGSKLPSERELVNQLEISRASVREALRMLEIMGLVEVKPGKGAYVRGLSGDLLSPFSSWLSLHKETLHNHFEARMVIEPAAAEFAAMRATQSDIRQLDHTLSVFKKKLDQNDIAGLIFADIQFHNLISASTGNKTIVILMDTITRFLYDGWKAALRIKGRPQKTIIEHEKIFQAIKGKDPKKARRAMEAHLNNAIRNLKKMGLE